MVATPFAAALQTVATPPSALEIRKGTLALANHGTNTQRRAVVLPATTPDSESQTLAEGSTRTLHRPTKGQGSERQILAHRVITENVAPGRTLSRSFHGTIPIHGNLPGVLHLTHALTVLQQPLREVPPQHQSLHSTANLLLRATARPCMARMRVQPKGANALPPASAVGSIRSGMKGVREAAPQAMGNP